MKHRDGYKVQVRDVPWWQPRYRIMHRYDIRDGQPKWREIGRFYRLESVERWLAQGWWEDVNG